MTTAVTAAVLITIVNQFNLEWWDKGSGGHNDGSFWTPRVPEGWHSVGSIGARGYDRPSTVFAVKAGSDASALAFPVNYELIWGDYGSGADLDGSFWRPICPGGYVALGVVAQRGYHKPGLSEVVCVYHQYAVPGHAGAFIWNDSGTGAHRDFGAWYIEDYPDHRSGFPMGTFLAVASHNKPGGKGHYHMIDSSAIGFGI